jgi:hypothetical protein
MYKGEMEKGRANALPALPPTAVPKREPAPGFLQTIREVIREHPGGFYDAVVDLALGKGEFAALEAELAANHARLETAAKILLRIVPQPGMFTEETVESMRGISGDPVAAGMIQFALDLAKLDRRLTAGEIEAASGLTIRILPIKDPFVVEDEGGRLMPGEGIDGSLIGLYATSHMPGEIRFIEGIAAIPNADGEKQLFPVGILENGAAFIEWEALA